MSYRVILAGFRRGRRRRCQFGRNSWRRPDSRRPTAIRLFSGTPNVIKRNLSQAGPSASFACSTGLARPARWARGSPAEHRRRRRGPVVRAPASCVGNRRYPPALPSAAPAHLRRTGLTNEAMYQRDRRPEEHRLLPWLLLAARRRAARSCHGTGHVHWSSSGGRCCTANATASRSEASCWLVLFGAIAEGIYGGIGGDGRERGAIRE